MKNKLNQLASNPYLYLSLTILLWGSSASIIKILLSNLSINSILFYTTLFATISLFLILVLQKKSQLIKELKIKDYFLFSIMGFVGIYLYYKFFYLALSISSIQEVFIINYTWALWIVIFSIFILKEKFNFIKILSIILGIFGVGIIVFRNTPIELNTSFDGYLFALLGAICYGLFSVLTKRFSYDKIVSISFYYFFAFIFITLGMFISNSFEIQILNIKELLGVIWIGIFCSGLGFVFWSKALENGNVNKMSNYILLVPFVSLVYMHFLLDEQISYTSIIGLVFIVVGIIIQRK